MRPLGLTARKLSIELGVPANRISSIVNGSPGITAETAILRGRRFVAHDLAIAREEMAA